MIIAAVLYCLMRRKKKQKKNSNSQYVPGLEDLIEMRTRTHSGGAESRGNRDLLELGKERLLFVFNMKSYRFQTILLRLVGRKAARTGSKAPTMYYDISCMFKRATEIKIIPIRFQ